MFVLPSLLLFAPTVRADSFGDAFDQKIRSSAAGVAPQSQAQLVEVINHARVTNHSTEDNGKEVSLLMTLDEQCVQKAVAYHTARVGPKQAEADIALWTEKLRGGQMSEMEYWTQVMECKDYCAQIMVDALDCYVRAGATRFRGMFLFDYNIGDFQPVTQGDARSNFRKHNNERLLSALVEALKNNPGDQVMLEGRASRTGSDVSNFKLSGKRAGAVREELIRRGITDDRIHYRWIGEGEPYYRLSLAELYKVVDDYTSFGQDTMNQSVSIYIFPRSSVPAL